MKSPFLRVGKMPDTWDCKCTYRKTDMLWNRLRNAKMERILTTAPDRKKDIYVKGYAISIRVQFNKVYLGNELYEPVISICKRR